MDITSLAWSRELLMASSRARYKYMVGKLRDNLQELNVVKNQMKVPDIFYSVTVGRPHTPTPYIC